MDSNEIIKTLKQSPLFAMSLSSKELFHSNFWAWLITTDEIKPQNIFATVFFEDLKHQEIVVKREEKNRDLTIWCNGQAYVIENKIKSVPYKEQLENYQQALSSDFKKGLLTGIYEPDFLSKMSNWSFLSYHQISQKMLSVLKKVECSDFIKNLITEYCNMIKNLDFLIKTTIDENKKIYLSHKDCPHLNEIRFCDVCLKFNAKLLEQYVKNQIEDEINTILQGKEFKLHIGTWFSNKDSLLDVFIIKNENLSNEEKIGVQVQGTEYRKFAQKKGELTCQELFDLYKLQGWFFDIDRKTKHNRQINGEPTSLRNKLDFCKYEAGSGRERYHFVYQYINLTRPTFDFLTQRIKADILKAIEIEA